MLQIFLKNDKFAFVEIRMGFGSVQKSIPSTVRKALFTEVD